jgi:hypothetical protein
MMQKEPAKLLLGFFWCQEKLEKFFFNRWWGAHTFSKRFCLLELRVVKVGESSSYDTSSHFFASKIYLFSGCDATSSSFNGNPLI